MRFQALSAAVFAASSAFACAAATAPAAATTASSAPAGGLAGDLAARVTRTLRSRRLPDSAQTKVELTLDSSLQAAAEAELAALGRLPGTKEASLVALDPTTGEVLALGGWRAEPAAGLDAELPVKTVYLSGSVAKAFSIAAAIDDGAIAPAATVEGGARFEGFGVTMSDRGVHGKMSVEDVLAFSSNVGAAQIAAVLGKTKVREGLERFGFGRVPEIELQGAATGALPPSWTDADAVRTATGAILATPLQFATAFAAFADGQLRQPTLVRGATGVRPAPRRVLTPEHAATMRRLLEGVVARDDGTGTEARVRGVRVFGKTGTAQLPDGASYGSFVGAAPAASPRVVVYVGVKTTADGYTGGTIAAPSFARVVERGLGERLRGGAVVPNLPSSPSQ